MNEPQAAQPQRKQKEFNKAMERYHNDTRYALVYRWVSFFNVSMQVLLFFVAISLDVPWFGVGVSLFIAYFITDFVNGLVHMYMDNNANYTSLWGPFIASFHLHHKTQKYKESNIFSIYLHESGPKFWLVIYLSIVGLLSFTALAPMLMMILIMVGILSSVAEVSHYLCHNATSPLVAVLQKYRILLPMSHHKEHHEKDNVGYAFLNGMSDVLIDKIAAKLYAGYQQNTDRHFENYEGVGTSNREG